MHADDAVFYTLTGVGLAVWFFVLQHVLNAVALAAYHGSF